MLLRQSILKTTMRKLFVVGLLMMLVLQASGQYVHHESWEHPFLGSKRVFAGVGYQFVTGVPTFSVVGIGEVTPSQFSNYGTAVGTVGFDMSSNEDGFGWGFFINLDLYRDGWKASFDGGTTYGAQYAPYTYNYTLSGLEICGALGLNINYIIAERFQILLGACFYFDGMTKVNVTSSITDAYGKDYGEDKVSSLTNWGAEPNMNIGIVTQLQFNYFIGDNFSVGLCGRFDALPFYSSWASDDYSDMYYIGSIMTAANDHRRKTQAMVTFGYKW